MTKIQRQKHIQELNNILVNAGAELDRWGTYRLKDFKFDTRETNLKVYKGKQKILSKPMVRISTLEFKNYLNKIK